MTDLAVAPDTAAKAVTTASFTTDVVSASQRVPVLVHFLSARSEPCRALQLTLEKAAKAADGKIKLVTMDIDAHPQIAGRLGIRAVPAVYAFQKGQPIDGFVGPLPEAQVKGFIERLVGPLDDGLDEALAEAEGALASGDLQAASAIFGSVLDTDPEHLAALSGMVRTLVAAGDLEAALKRPGAGPAGRRQGQGHRRRPGRAGGGRGRERDR